MSDDFHTLMDRVRNGSDEAAQELLDLYGDHIFRAVRRRLNRSLRSKYDSQDFVQAVWASFFANLPTVREFDRPEALIAFLARVASNKVIDECRTRLQTEKNDIKRERSMESVCVGTTDPLKGNDPTPSQVAIANEQWGRMIDGQPSHYRRIMELRAEGISNNEIADRLEINEKTVRRVVQRQLKRLSQ